MFLHVPKKERQTIKFRQSSERSDSEVKVPTSKSANNTYSIIAELLPRCFLLLSGILLAVLQIPVRVKESITDSIIAVDQAFKVQKHSSCTTASL
jgi:hypothetical protein